MQPNGKKDTSAETHSDVALYSQSPKVMLIKLYRGRRQDELAAKGGRQAAT